MRSINIEKRASWLELFFDLIFVASFIQLGNALGAEITLLNFFGFCLSFTMLWMVWTGTTFYINRFTIDDVLHRLLIFIEMFAIGVMAISAHTALSENNTIFLISYVVAQLIVSLLYFRSWYQQKQARQYSGFWGTVFFVTSLVWMASIFLPQSYQYLLWGLGIIGLISVPFSKASRALTEIFPLDDTHISERYGLLTLIVLGESFVKILSTLSQKTLSSDLIFQSVLILSVTCSVWWVYFDDVAGAKLKKKSLALPLWLYGHLPLQIGITALGVGIKIATNFEFENRVEFAHSFLLIGSLALTFLSVSMIDAVTERKNSELSDQARVNFRLLTGFLLVFAAFLSSTMTGGLIIGLLILICLAQVVFDVIFSPQIEIEGYQDYIQNEFKDVSFKETVTKRNRDIGRAVRKGMPSDFRKDIYFYFVQSSWLQFFFSLVFIYLVFNLFFAFLYLIQPNTIENASPNSFSDAFFFSVQTMSTIGYGSLHPAGIYSNTIVTIEAVTGLLFVAMATGLVFAKASKPRSSVLFTNSMVITEMDGVKYLVFRVGNTRGNDIVDASITFSALIDYRSSEGHHLRKVRDLKLVRDRTPFFSLSWTVMHKIDDDSPVRCLVESSEGQKIIAFLALLVGHDGTYSQTVYARNTYYPEDIERKKYFVDVLETLPDGRLMIDYSKFHETKDSQAEKGEPK